jgi:hypothetical protein
VCSDDSRDSIAGVRHRSPLVEHGKSSTFSNPQLLKSSNTDLFTRDFVDGPGIDCYAENEQPILFLQGGVEMVAYEPRVRRRGFFLHSVDTSEPETGEHDSAEGVSVRARTATRSENPRQFTSIRRSRLDEPGNDASPEIRSGSVTGSRQRSHLPR